MLSWPRTTDGQPVDNRLRLSGVRLLHGRATSGLLLAHAGGAQARPLALAVRGGLVAREIARHPDVVALRRPEDRDPANLDAGAAPGRREPAVHVAERRGHRPRSRQVSGARLHEARSLPPRDPPPGSG